jgi:putative flippase GtrA|tara:strand:+ start:7007 stop:7399 length:393 start_codon:yes stop_codon:yes gene_type:complete
LETNQLIRFTKFGLWGPFGLLVQIGSSLILSDYFGIHHEVSFFLAIIITIHVNYSVASRYIFKREISLKTYFRFLGSSGLSRFMDLGIYFVLASDVHSPLNVIIPTLLGAVMRFAIYEFYVFRTYRIDNE